MNIFFVLIAILKIVGIILGVLVCILAVLLLSPIVYRASLLKEKQSVKVYYLYPLLSYQYSHSSEETSSHFRFLWFKFKGTADETESPAGAEEDTEKTVHKKKTKKESPSKVDTEKDTVPSPEKDRSEKEKSEAKGKKESIFSSAKSSLQNFQRITDKKKIIQKTIWMIKKLLRHIWPGKIEGRCVLGLENPAYTGFILAAVWPVIGLTNSSFVLLGDFEEEKLEYNVKMKGHIIPGYIVWILIRYILHKPVWQAIKILRKKDDVNVSQSKQQS